MNIAQVEHVRAVLDWDWSQRELRRNFAGRSQSGLLQEICFFYNGSMGKQCTNGTLVPRTGKVMVALEEASSGMFKYDCAPVCSVCRMASLDLFRGVINNLTEEELWARLLCDPGLNLMKKSEDHVLRRFGIGCAVRSLTHCHIKFDDMLHVPSRALSFSHSESLSDKLYHGGRHDIFDDVIKALES